MQRNFDSRSTRTRSILCSDSACIHCKCHLQRLRIRARKPCNGCFTRRSRNRRYTHCGWRNYRLNCCRCLFWSSNRRRRHSFLNRLRYRHRFRYRCHRLRWYCRIACIRWNSCCRRLTLRCCRSGSSFLLLLRLRCARRLKDGLVVVQCGRSLICRCRTLRRLSARRSRICLVRILGMAHARRLRQHAARQQYRRQNQTLVPHHLPHHLKENPHRTLPVQAILSVSSCTCSCLWSAFALFAPEQRSGHAKPPAVRAGPTCSYVRGAYPH